MVFSFPKIRKTKGDGTPSSRGKKFGFAIGKKAVTSTTKKPAVDLGKSGPNSAESRNGSGSFNSPMPAIEEDIPETIGTDLTDPETPSTPIMSNVNVLDYGDNEEGAEIVFGAASNLISIPEVPQQVESSDQITTDAKDEVKRQLFEPDEPVEEPDSKALELAAQPDEPEEVEQQPEELGEQPPTSEAEVDEPFDEKEMKKEDPYILEVMQSESNPVGWKFAAQKVNSMLSMTRQVTNKAGTPETASREVHGPGDGGVGAFLELFKCGDVTTSLFYDTLCTQGSPVKKRKRPYFNELFALNFILETTIDGIPMLHHVPPTNPIDNDWSGRSVTMFIQPGHSNGPYIVHPKLVWKSDPGSKPRKSDELSFAVDILDIHSVMDSIDDNVSENADEGDLCFFSVTTNSGDVHLFECLSEEERDRVASGIKNVIARMAYSLVVGDNHVMTELYSEGDQDEGELPALKTEGQELADISHAFLDSIAIATM